MRVVLLAQLEELRLPLSHNCLCFQKSIHVSVLKTLIRCSGLCSLITGPHTTDLCYYIYLCVLVTNQSDCVFWAQHSEHGLKMLLEVTWTKTFSKYDTTSDRMCHFPCGSVLSVTY